MKLKAKYEKAKIFVTGELNPKIQDWGKIGTLRREVFVLIQISDFPATYLHSKYHKMRKLSIEGNTGSVQPSNRRYSEPKFYRVGISPHDS